MKAYLIAMFILMTINVVLTINDKYFDFTLQHIGRLTVFVGLLIWTGFLLF
jgi:hypothetical protein